MSFRSSLLPLVNTVRGIATNYGTRNYTVVIRTETFSDANQLGTPTTADVTITPTPKVREAAQGRELTVGPITPDHATGGYTPAELKPSASTSTRVTYRVTGDNGTREYILKDVTTDRGYSYFLQLVAIEHAGPY